MLLTKTVMMKWNPSNREWYKSKGYQYTSWHDEFEVKIEDLSPTSQHILEFICDYCEKPHDRKYDRYKTKYKNNHCDKHSCDECEHIRLEENEMFVVNEGVKDNNYEKHYLTIINGKEIFIKQCKTCGKYKEVLCFKENKASLNIEYSNQCMECDKDFKELNTFAYKLRHYKESSVKMNLPIPMTEKQLEKVYDRFDSRCALTDSINTSCEHFIPVSWGHGGTYSGNIYLIKYNLNMSKGNINPFVWIRTPKVKKNVDIKKWNKLIKYLAAQNKMTV